MPDSPDQAQTKLVRALTYFHGEPFASDDSISVKWLDLASISYSHIVPGSPHESRYQARRDSLPALRRRSKKVEREPWQLRSERVERCSRVNYSMLVMDTDWESWLDDDKIGDPAIAERFAESIEESLSSPCPALFEAIITILQTPNANSLLAGVAAQRVRAIAMTSEDIRIRTWDALHARLDGWLSQTDSTLHSYALAALPSALQVGRAHAVSAVADWIRSGSNGVAQSAAMGFFSGTSRAGCMANLLPAEDIDLLYASIKERLVKSDDWELSATLIWALGPIATKEKLPEIAETLAVAFVRGQGREDASAVRVGKMVTRTWRSAAMKQLRASFQDQDRCDLFLTLVCLQP